MTKAASGSSGATCVVSIAPLRTRSTPALPPDRFGNLYFDLAGARGAAAISCLVLTAALSLVHWAQLPTLGRVLIGAPAASCILSATVGFCAGCGYYVLGRDMLVRSGLVRGAPEGVRDVDVERG